mgnify:CR=1 FL=1
MAQKSVSGQVMRNSPRSQNHWYECSAHVAKKATSVAIAGHRTTYGAPFGNVDQLEPGDEITITTVQGTFTYLVRETVIVAPSGTAWMAFIRRFSRTWLSRVRSAKSSMGSAGIVTVSASTLTR